jgi:hypothetical protein
VKAKVTADDIAQLLASAPPRLVPAHVQKAASRLGAQHGFMAVFGLLFGGMGLFFVAVFFPWRFWDEGRLASAGAATTTGVVLAVRETNMSINETRVMEYDFRYRPPGGREFTGQGYTTGGRWSAEAPVVVRYLPDEPEVACIEGARLSEGGLMGVGTLIFPLVGGGLVWWWARNRRRTHRLLHLGRVTEVDVVSVDETTTKVNYQSVYKIVVAGPELAGGQPVTVKRVNKPDVNLALKRARDRQPVYVLFDPQRPKHLLFPEAWVEVGV